MDVQFWGTICCKAYPFSINFLVPLSPYLYGSTSGLSVMLHWVIRLYVHQCHTPVTIATFIVRLEVRCVSPPYLFFSINIVFATLLLLSLHKNFTISLLMPTKQNIWILCCGCIQSIGPIGKTQDLNTIKPSYVWMWNLSIYLAL
jgi:hypothetical protein